jgi:hypothetical protein
MGGAMSLRAPPLARALRALLRLALLPTGLQCLASAHGDVLVDQTPGCSQPACAILCSKPPVSPLQAAIAECCDRNSDP